MAKDFSCGPADGRLASMLTGGSDASWKKYGETEAYFGVVTHEKFKKENLAQNIDLFFRSGEVHIEETLRTIHQRLDASFKPKRTLEFGCGVGRLTIPLARVSESVVALDISEAMRAEAKKNCTERGLNNVTFAESDDELTHAQGTFNFLVSHVVFQHISPRRTERILKRMIDRLEPGGMGSLHFCFAGTASKPRRMFHHSRKVVPFLNNIANLLEGKKLGTPMMQMNRSNLNRLLRIFLEKGCHRLYVEFTGQGAHEGGEYGLICFFQKVSLPSFPYFDLSGKES